MSKSLRSFPEAMRPIIAKRRLAGNTKGNGYWAAVDAATKLGLNVSTPKAAPLSQIEKDERASKRRDRAESPKRSGYRVRDYVAA